MSIRSNRQKLKSHVFIVSLQDVRGGLQREAESPCCFCSHRGVMSPQIKVVHFKARANSSSSSSISDSNSVCSISDCIQFPKLKIGISELETKTSTHLLWLGGVFKWKSESPVGKKSACSAGDTGDVGSIPESGRSPGGGNDNPPSILAWKTLWTEEPGGLQSIGVAKSRTWLSD